MSNFLALLIKLDDAGGEERSTLGHLMVMINIVLVLAVLVTSWCGTQQTVDGHRESFGNAIRQKWFPAKLRNVLDPDVVGDDKGEARPKEGR